MKPLLKHLECSILRPTAHISVPVPQLGFEDSVPQVFEYFPRIVIGLEVRDQVDRPFTLAIRKKSWPFAIQTFRPLAIRLLGSDDHNAPVDHQRAASYAAQ